MRLYGFDSVADKWYVVDPRRPLACLGPLTRTVVYRQHAAVGIIGLSESLLDATLEHMRDTVYGRM
jgi:hypothetical protein